MCESEALTRAGEGLCGGGRGKGYNAIKWLSSGRVQWFDYCLGLWWLYLEKYFLSLQSLLLWKFLMLAAMVTRRVTWLSPHFSVWVHFCRWWGSNTRNFSAHPEHCSVPHALSVCLFAGPLCPVPPVGKQILQFTSQRRNQSQQHSRDLQSSLLLFQVISLPCVQKSGCFEWVHAQFCREHLHVHTHVQVHPCTPCVWLYLVTCCFCWHVQFPA